MPIHENINTTQCFIGFHMPDEPYGFLSNWYMCEFSVDGKKYNCVEQCMMEQKALLFGDTDIAGKIMATSDQSEMQALGRQAKGFDSVVWNGHKQLIVYKALYAKFSQNADLKTKLLATGDARLAECSRSDLVWGIGMSARDKGVEDISNWKGQNLLGFALEMLRSELGKA